MRHSRDVVSDQVPGERDRDAADWTEGMPVGHHSPYTPAGEIEQFGKVAGGLIRLKGWRRGVARLIVVAILLLMVAAVVGGEVFALVTGSG
jgi:hypothetical protein